MQARSRTKTVLGWSLWIGGIVLLAVGFGVSSDLVWQYPYTTRERGMVVETIRLDHPIGRFATRIVVQHRDASGFLREFEDTSYFTDHVPGDEVRIAYWRSNSAAAQIDTFKPVWLLMLALACLGGQLATAGHSLINPSRSLSFGRWTLAVGLTSLLIVGGLVAAFFGIMGGMAIGFSPASGGSADTADALFHGGITAASVGLITLATLVYLTLVRAVYFLCSLCRSNK
jgi:hypothetical protein